MSDDIDPEEPPPPYSPHPGLTLPSYEVVVASPRYHQTDTPPSYEALAASPGYHQTSAASPEQPPQTFAALVNPEEHCQAAHTTPAVVERHNQSVSTNRAARSQIQQRTASSVQNAQPCVTYTSQRYGRSLTIHHLPKRPGSAATSSSRVIIHTHRQGPPRDYTVWAILVTIFCCFPIGLCAYYKAKQAQEESAQGHIETARSKSRLAKNLIIAAGFTGFLCFLPSLISGIWFLVLLIMWY